MDQKNKLSYLFFTVFSAGMTTLAVEMAASRLLGGVFGTSNLVWASIIGLILIYLTAGYFLGGRWADRSPSPVTFYSILAWGGFSAGIVPFISKPILTAAANAFDHLQVGVLLGSFSAVLILFVIPITLLGTISPFAIRLSLRDPRQAGVISGRIYAISTLGSFVGTFLPVLVLIPLLGTTLTFVIFSTYLVLVALVGLGLAGRPKVAYSRAWMILVLAILAVLWGSGAIKNTPGQIYETESSYNYIQVLQDGEYRLLRLNEGQGIHSIYHPQQIAYQGTWMQALAAPFFNSPPYLPGEVDSMAVVGLAAGTTARQATAAFGPIPIDGFEIDPRIIEVGQTYFGMNQPNLNPIAVDGRWGLEHSGKHYSLISIDAYRPPYIPWHLTTREFFQVVYDHLTPDGAMALNVGRTPEEEQLLSGLVSTIETVFPSVYVMDLPYSYNSMIYATVQPTRAEYLEENFQIIQNMDGRPEILAAALNNAVQNLRPLPEGGVVFTDDRAPVEWITNNMVFNYIFSGEDY